MKPRTKLAWFIFYFCLAIVSSSIIAGSYSVNSISAEQTLRLKNSVPSPLAQSCTIEIQPKQPHSSNEITISLSGEWNNTCVPRPQSFQRNGQDINILFEAYPPTTVCGQAISPWSGTIDVGTLPQGNYAVHGETAGCEVKQFTVFNETAEYQIKFDATWDPTGVPFPHFSPLIGATHNENAVFWKTGDLATDGIEVMAETGGTFTLRNEIESNSDANSTILGSGIGSPGNTTINSITVTQDFPLVTLVTMIAPSPDWFVGVSGLSLKDGQGEWIDEVVVQLRPYDAGTDSGPSFTSQNDDTNPAENIFLIQDENLFPNEFLGTFTFTRINKPEPTPTVTPMPTETPEPFVPTDFIYLPIIQ